MKSLLVSADMQYVDELSKLELSDEMLDVISGGLSKNCKECADVTTVRCGDTDCTRIDCVSC